MAWDAHRKTQRNQNISRLYAEGDMTLQEIADKYGITRERVRQIAYRDGLNRGSHPRKTKTRWTYCPVCKYKYKNEPGKSYTHARQAGHRPISHTRRGISERTIEMAHAYGDPTRRVEDIANEYGVGKIAVRAAGRRMGIFRRGPNKRGRTLTIGFEEAVLTVRSLRNKGIRPVEIAGMMGVTPGYIRHLEGSQVPVISVGQPLFDEGHKLRLEALRKARSGRKRGSGGRADVPPAQGENVNQ